MNSVPIVVVTALSHHRAASRDSLMSPTFNWSSFPTLGQCVDVGISVYTGEFRVFFKPGCTKEVLLPVLGLCQPQSKFSLLVEWVVLRAGTQRCWVLPLEGDKCH